jgi:hypothetical protein
MKDKSVEINRAVVADFNNGQGTNYVRFEAVTAVNMNNIFLRCD